MIELLVVIAILSLLVAILVPSLMQAKRLAQNVICKTNLHQYGLAEATYLGEYSGNFVNTMFWLYSDGGWNCRWHDESIEPDGTLWPYLMVKDIHCCPTFEWVAKLTGCPHCGATDIEPQYSYSKNASLNGDAGPLYDMPWVRNISWASPRMVGAPTASFVGRLERFGAKIP